MKKLYKKIYRVTRRLLIEQVCIVQAENPIRAKNKAKSNQFFHENFDKDSYIDGNWEKIKHLNDYAYVVERKKKIPKLKSHDRYY